MSDLIPRHALSLAREQLDLFPGLVIEGARQVGKSTLAAMLVTGQPATCLSLDDEPTRAAAVADPQWFVTQGADGVLVVDEIQRVPELTLAFKADIDRDRRPGRFVLTGSASLLRVRGLADSLVGRVGRLTLFGLSQGERQHQRDDFVGATTAVLADHHDSDLVAFSSQVTRDDYVDLVAVGGFPSVVHLSERQRRLWHDAYVDGLVHKDLGELNRQYDPRRALAVLRVLAARPSAELVKAKLAQHADLPASTVTTYLDLFDAVGLTTTLPAWTTNLSSRQGKRDKSLLLDSGLATRLSRLTVHQLGQPAHSESFGAYLESFVAAELLKQRTWSDEEFELFHYRERTGAEVDLVVELADGRVIGIEVKASTTYKGDSFNGLRHLRDKVGQRFLAGFVLSTAATGYRYADRLYGLPISSLWSLPSPAL
ncbi:MAG: ATP-binding protein [Micrococcales bacterium]|nr:ATP-binding protein [Micrococcales bacterium]